MAEDYYHILGVASDAPERAIKRAYHDLARRIHPDKASSPEEAARLQEEFAAVTRAYNTLKDPGRRKEYDGQRAREGGGAAAPAAAPSPVSPTGPKATVRTEKGGPVDRAVEAGRLSIAERSYQRGLQFSHMGDDVRAIEFFETATRNNAEDARYHAALAKSLMKTRRGFTRSVEAASRACQIDQYNVEYKLILAEIYERAGSASLAIKQYENILRWDTDNLDARRRLNALQGGSSSSTFINLWRKLKSRFGAR